MSFRPPSRLRIGRRKALGLAAGMAVLPGALRRSFAQDDTRFDFTTIERPPLDSRQAFIDFITATRGDDPQMAGRRWDRCQALIGNSDLWQDKEIEAFLLTPREIFALERNRARAYEHAFLDIGYGVTISGPHIVGRMTSALDVQPDERTLEIGTGSGYQSAILAYLTRNPYSIEIIEPLAERTTALYAELAGDRFPEYGNIGTKAADGYFGWEEQGPFQKIIVTAAIDHIPPPLLQQLDVGGVMVIPVGPPGAQTLLKVSKVEEADGTLTITREDLYQGRRKVSFVPFTNTEGGTWSQ